MVTSKVVRLNAKSRGFHLITSEIINAIGALPAAGILQVFIQHTSAAITINENADPSVRRDLEAAFDLLAKENEPWYTHTMEGPDDMPAHIKAALIGSSVSIPIQDGHLMLGTWQGIYLCEFRDRAHSRKLIISVIE